MKWRLAFGLISMLSAYALLIPGLTEPVLHMQTTLDKEELANLGKQALLQSEAIPNFLLPVTMEVLNQIQVDGKVLVQDTAKSILATAQTLWQQQNYLVAVLIISFSVLVPALKLLFLALALALKNRRGAHFFALSSGALSKWSMADVFAVALLMTFLAIQSTHGTSQLIETQINLQAGFYYFLGYTLLAIVSSQLLHPAQPKETSA